MTPSLPTAADPGLQNLIKMTTEDLANRLSIAPDEISLVEATAVEWSDSSLDCPQEGMSYLPVFTPGYRIRLEAGGQEYEYHADRGSRVLSCDNHIRPGTPGREAATPDRFDPPPTGLPERVPPTETVSSVTGEVPAELLEKIVADLTGRTGIPSDRILVIQAQATVWNDGSLGCPQPGVFYTQALVNGFWVILQAEGQHYDYRALESGYFFICENGAAPLAPRGTPES